MKKLISLEQYVDELQNKNCDSVENSVFPYIETDSILQSIYYYNDQLKQIPQLNRFIPAIEKDGGWVVLEKPTIYDPRSKTGNTEHHLFDKAETEYQYSLDSVWFDGWEVCATDYDYIQIMDINGCVISINKNGLVFINQGEIVTSYSDLTKHNLPLNDNGVKAFNL